MAKISKAALRSEEQKDEGTRVRGHSLLLKEQFLYCGEDENQTQMVNRLCSPKCDKFVPFLILQTEMEAWRWVYSYSVLSSTGVIATIFSPVARDLLIVCMIGKKRRLLTKYVGIGPNTITEFDLTID